MFQRSQYRHLFPSLAENHAYTSKTGGSKYPGFGTEGNADLRTLRFMDLPCDKIFSVSLDQLQEEVKKVPPVVKDVKVNDGEKFVKTTQINKPSSSDQPKASSSSLQPMKRSAFSHPNFTGGKKSKVVKEGCVGGGQSSISSRVLFLAVLGSQEERKNGTGSRSFWSQSGPGGPTFPNENQQVNQVDSSFRNLDDLSRFGGRLFSHHKFRHFLRLVWADKVYSFKALSFDLATAPLVLPGFFRLWCLIFILRQYSFTPT
ncbi:Hypothetical predicted protein [Mytilus galloprovincialis]|uniref:Uncharacterized protein n=1 Tax=Mytilus galloprovincialis TaxID=29158 RepID=A0A8B6CKZ7_MYTGA|nr:Hypothetical predicted protein [Mytilus galloprovincialis]